MGLFMIGNLFREVKVVGRLLKASQDELLNIVTIFLGLGVGSTMMAENFLRPAPIFIFFLGLVAFAFSTVGGVLFAKLMNLFLKEKINPLIGSAGVSAVPMAARVSTGGTGVRSEESSPHACHGAKRGRSHRHGNRGGHVSHDA